ncbi:potassium transporter [Pyrrhoderma noxium]|uniref:Potassium transporter n=1 Tax=Pyrrhoderma noxium TaxID=2282107 RepID=A0A286UX76_9AGAM|nr:potassium transporter [Pyrrhoderma noxium]
MTAKSDVPEEELQGRPSYVRRAPKLTGFMLFATAFQTIGIIYSDIGTSPLYTLNGIWPADGPFPSKEDIIGGVSAIIWSLTLVPLLKYVVVCLRFGTKEGEGGSFALYHGLFPPKLSNADTDRVLTGDQYAFNKNGSFSSSGSTLSLAKLKWPLLSWALLGTSLTMADGILTPAVSVTSAVSGISVVKPSVSDNVTSISIGFLVVLFLVQFLGTSRLASGFAPITFTWFGLLGVTGIVNITTFPGIFRAFDPSRAILLFVRTRDYDLLAGVLLALTGSEAMFANLGQFNAASIRLAFSGFVYPCLILAYLGQGARLIHDGESVFSNIFYLTIPGKTNGPLFWIFFIFAILATLIASQAMITATFSLVQQVINMRSLPPLRMLYTSDRFQGQIYVPFVNYILLIACVIIVAAFKSSTALADAYGFAVTTVFISTTVLLTLQIRFIRRNNIFVTMAFFFFFGFIDCLFWGASLKKVPSGAWVPLMIGTLLATFMVFWTWAKGLEDKFDGANRRNLRLFISEGDDGANTVHIETADERSLNEHDRGSGVTFERDAPTLYYMARTTMQTPTDEKSMMVWEEEKRKLPRIDSCAIFHKLTPGSGVPHSFIGFVRQWPSLPRVVIFLSVRMLPVAHITSNDRYEVTKVRSLTGFYGVTYYLGFRDEFEVKVDEVIQNICLLERQIDPQGSERIIAEIHSAAKTSTHIVPHYHVTSKRSYSGKLGKTLTWLRMMLIEEVYRRIAIMFPETENWLGSADEIIRVGINAEI